MRIRYEDKENYISGVLKEEAASRIDFHIQRLHIDGKLISYVGDLIANGTIKVYVNKELKADAIYLEKENKLYIKELPDASDDLDTRGLIVHEAVHVVLDLKKAGISPNPTTTLTSEAAACLAQVIYLRHKGKKDFTKEDQIFISANELINKEKMMKGNAWISWPRYKGLRDDIKKDEIYKDINDAERIIGNGIIVERSDQSGCAVGSLPQTVHASKSAEMASPFRSGRSEREKPSAEPPPDMPPPEPDDVFTERTGAEQSIMPPPDMTPPEPDDVFTERTGAEQSIMPPPDMPPPEPDDVFTERTGAEQSIMPPPDMPPPEPPSQDADLPEAYEPPPDWRR
jgi:tRNA splicing endonuclease